MPMNDELKVFAGCSNPGLADEICGCLNIRRSGLRISRFSNDNLSVQIEENVRERDVFVLQAFTEPASDRILELLNHDGRLAQRVRSPDHRGDPLFLLRPLRQEGRARISIAGRLIADLLRTAGADRVLTMDLHAEQVHGFFSIPVDQPDGHSHSRRAMWRRPARWRIAVVVATDAGGAKRRRQVRHAPSPAAGDHRQAPGERHRGAPGHVVGDVAGKDAVVFEDEIATGSTMAETARTLAAAGARQVVAGANARGAGGHAIDNLREAAIASFTRHQHRRSAEEQAFGEDDSAFRGALMAEAIRRIHTGESVGALFPRKPA